MILENALSADTLSSMFTSRWSSLSSNDKQRSSSPMLYQRSSAYQFTENCELDYYREAPHLAVDLDVYSSVFQAIPSLFSMENLLRYYQVIFLQRNRIILWCYFREEKILISELDALYLWFGIKI